MKMKKSLISTTLGLSILCFGTGASAAENDALVDSDVTQSIKQAENPNLIGTMAAPTNSSRTDTYSPFLGGTYAVSKSSSTATEDYIYARARTFNGDGALINSKSASANKTTYICARADNGTIYFGNDWALGNHTYKLSGYKDVVHETKAYW
ncbi:XoxI protein [Bacillus sp. F19]|nr:XoxI protein [Bacillus sp. F19]